MAKTYSTGVPHHATRTGLTPSHRDDHCQVCARIAPNQPAGSQLREMGVVRVAYGHAPGDRTVPIEGRDALARANPIQLCTDAARSGPPATASPRPLSWGDFLNLFADDRRDSAPPEAPPVDGPQMEPGSGPSRVINRISQE